MFDSRKLLKDFWGGIVPYLSSIYDPFSALFPLQGTETFFTLKEGVFSTSPSLLQGELHLSHQASLPSGTRGCNRPPVLRTASL